MQVTPLDIRQQQFKRKFRGLDPLEVFPFLETVANELEAIVKENVKLKERLRELEERLNTYHNMEKTLENALIVAQKAAEELQLNAQKEAELIIKDAELRGEKLVEEARSRANQVYRELEELKKEKDQFEAKMRALLETQLKFLNLGKEEPPGEGGEE